jgi:hypothetical protein
MKYGCFAAPYVHAANFGSSGGGRKGGEVAKGTGANGTNRRRKDIADGELRLRWRLGIGLLKILASCENEVA